MGNSYQPDPNVSGPSASDAPQSGGSYDQRRRDVHDAGEESRDAHERGALTSAASQIMRHWTEAQNAKTSIEHEMIRQQYERNDEYTPEQKAKIKASETPEIFVPLTSSKADALVSWIRSTLAAVNPGEQFWGLEPTPIPEMPSGIKEEVVQRVMQEFAPIWQMGQMVEQKTVEDMARDLSKQVMKALDDEAEERAKLMEEQIEDQLLEGGFYGALDEMIDDMGHAQTVFIRGPILVPRVRMAPTRNEDGSVAMTAKEDIIFKFHRVSQFDVYPAPNSRGVNDRYMFYRMRLSRGELYELRGAKSVDRAAIDLMLVENMVSSNKITGVDNERDEIENRDHTQGHDDTFEVLEYWGELQGAQLSDWGVEGINDIARVYQVQAWYSTRTQQIIRMVLNPSPSGKRPFFATGVHKVADSFWHRSLVTRSHNDQVILNAYFRAIVDNLSHAATDIPIYNDVSRLARGQSPTKHFAKRVYVFEPPKMTSGTHQRPLEFHRTNKLELSREIEQVYRLADIHTGIPSHIAGANASGAANTASGMAMQLDSAGKKVRDILSDLDKDIIGPVIQWMFDWNMLFNPREDIKGDARIVPRGALAAVRNESVAAKYNQLLASTANPLDMAILGKSGRAAMLKESMDGMHMNSEEIVSDDHVNQLRRMDEMTRMAEMAMMTSEATGPSGAPSGGPGMDNPDNEKSIQTDVPPSIAPKPNTPIETPSHV